jgi:hypothetical protein
MPVSSFPCGVTLPLQGLAKGKRAFVAATITSFTVALILLLRAYATGRALMRTPGRRGGPGRAGALAREPRRGGPGVAPLTLRALTRLTDHAWLEKTARQDYPAAVYPLGVRLNYDEHVRQPEGWTGPGSHRFPRPERGRRLSDRARGLVCRPQTEEALHYRNVYRNNKWLRGDNTA